MLAVDAFRAACLDHRLAISKTLEAEREIRWILMRVALGPFLPGLQSEFLQLALALKDYALGAEGQVSPVVREYCDALSALREIEVEQEFLEAIEVSGVMASLAEGEGQGVVLHGEGEFDRILLAIADEFQLRAQQLCERIGRLSDRQVGVLCALFDARVANQQGYRGAITSLIGRYRDQIQPIGRRKGWTGRWVHRLARIDGKLALVRVDLHAERDRPQPPTRRTDSTEALPASVSTAWGRRLSSVEPQPLPRMVAYPTPKGRSAVDRAMRLANERISVANERIDAANAALRGVLGQSPLAQRLSGLSPARPRFQPGPTFPRGLPVPPPIVPPPARMLYNPRVPDFLQPRYARRPPLRPPLRLPAPQLPPGLRLPPTNPARFSPSVPFPGALGPVEPGPHPPFRRYRRSRGKLDEPRATANARIDEANEAIRSANEAIGKVVAAERAAARAQDERRFQKEQAAWRASLLSHRIGRLECWISEEMAELALERAAVELDEIQSLRRSQVEGA